MLTQCLPILSLHSKHLIAIFLSQLIQANTYSFTFIVYLEFTYFSFLPEREAILVHGPPSSLYLCHASLSSQRHDFKNIHFSYATPPWETLYWFLVSYGTKARIITDPSFPLPSPDFTTFDSQTCSNHSHTSHHWCVCLCPQPFAPVGGLGQAAIFPILSATYTFSLPGGFFLNVTLAMSHPPDHTI